MRGLAYWINPQHLTSDATERLKRSFADDPARTVWLDDFLLPEHCDRLERVFSCEGAFEDARQIYNYHGENRTRAVDLAEWQDADEAARFHHELSFLGPRPEHRMGIGFLTYLRYGKFLESAEHLGFLYRLTGIPLGGVSASMMRITRFGHRLDRHSDARPTRSLCSILYFSGGWDPAFGGRFRQYRGDEVLRSLDPRRNRLVIFEPTADNIHDVERMTPQSAGWERRAMTTWFGPPAE